MVDNTAFAKRLQEIQQEYNLTPASFADAIGVSRASISHILSGRHKPSLSFVMNVIKQYPAVNIYWLLNGTGTFPSTSNVEKTIHTEQKVINPKSIVAPIQKEVSESKSKKIKRIVILFEDGTFESYEQ